MAVVKTRAPRRGEVHLVGLDPTRGREMKKARPCVVVSPDELNAHLQTVIVAPLTSVGKPYPFRVPCHVERTPGLIVLDQIGTVDRERLMKRVGVLPAPALGRILAVLREMFEG
jgi:mRNA interferase MazF